MIWWTLFGAHAVLTVAYYVNRVRRRQRYLHGMQKTLDKGLTQEG